MIAREEMQAIGILSGTVQSLETRRLPPEEERIWQRDFGVLVDILREMIDPNLGDDLEKERSFYTQACEVAKGYLDKPFGGLKPSGGQYGFRMLMPQDWRDQAGGGTGHQWYSWRQTKSTGAATTAFDLWGTSTSPILAEASAEKKGVIAFHRIISYDPNPRVILLQLTVNDYPYSPQCVEPWSKINRAGRFCKLIPLPGKVLLSPGGKVHLKVWIDTRLVGTTAPSVATTIDIELAPFGLIFAEHGYLAIDSNIV